MAEQRNPEVAGGEQGSQQAANQLEAAAAPARVAQTPSKTVVTPESGERITIEHAPGAAGEVNAQAAPQLTDQDPPFGVELDDSEQQDLLPAYGNEDEEFLFGATDYPDTPANFGVTSTQPPAPRNTMQYLGTLADAASDPNAPDEIHMLLRVLTDLIEE